MNLYDKSSGKPVWFSFENKTGAAFAGGAENGGAKGRAFEAFADGEEKVLCDISGSGVIRRIWITMRDKSESALKNTILKMYWDESEAPAVNAPIGDFFCMGHGRMFPFENELFSSPEGRSFVCVIPMPFQTHAKITLTNQTGCDNSHLFYDVNLTLGDNTADSMYFHSLYTVSSGLPLGTDPYLLPPISGMGRFLGAHISVDINPAYPGSWWGEGEVKVYYDYDEEAQLPTLVGTGTEDYIGTGWGQGVYINRYQGCTIHDSKAGKASFYRLHIPDPIYFHKNCRVTIQDMGGASLELVRKYIADGKPCAPVTIDAVSAFECIYGQDVNLNQFPQDQWTNFYRQDDFYVTSYFYSVRPDGHAAGRL